MNGISLIMRKDTLKIFTRGWNSTIVQNWSRYSLLVTAEDSKLGGPEFDSLDGENFLLLS